MTLTLDAFDKFFQLSDDELMELIKTNRAYINRIVRQRLVIVEITSLVVGIGIGCLIGVML